MAHVRRLEEVMIRTCREFDVDVTRVDGRSGVWALADDQPGGRPDRKLGAIGVRVSRQVTMHGFAFNVNTDLSYFHPVKTHALVFGFNAVYDQFRETPSLDVRKRPPFLDLL